MESELINELTELLTRWDAMARHARVQAEARSDSTFDGYLLGLEVATDDLTRILGKALKPRQTSPARMDN